MKNAILIFLAFSTAPFSQSLAQHSEAVDRQAEQSVRQADRDLLVRDLTSSPSFEVRERAMFALWGDYENSRSQVEQLAAHPDPEVSRRARWILDRWEIGILPELPWSLRNTLANSAADPAQAFATLLDAGRLREAIEVARHAITKPTAAPLRLSIAEVVARRFTDLVVAGLESNELERLVELLEITAITEPLAVARVMLLDRIHVPLNDENILPQCLRTETREIQFRVATICWGVVGNFDKAEETARQLPEPQMLSRVLLLAGQWEKLAQLSSECVEPELPVDATLDQYVMWLLAANEAGFEDQVDAVTKEIVAGELSHPLRWQCLALAGQIDTAIEVAKKIDKLAAVELLEVQLRHDEAFELLQIDPANPRPGIDRLLSESKNELEKLASNPASGVFESDALEKLTTALQLLHGVGIRELVGDTILKMAAIDEGGDANGLARLQALITARRLGLTDIMPDILATAGPPANAQRDRTSRALLVFFAGRSNTLMRMVTTGVSQIDASKDARQQWQAVLNLLNGIVPDGWDPTTDLDTLYELSKGAPGNPAGQNLVFQPSPTVAQFFTSLGRDDLAIRCYSDATSGLYNPVMGIELAQRLLSSGDADGALALFQQVAKWGQSDDPYARVWTQDPEDASLPSIASALAGQTLALRRLGREDQAQEIERALDLVPFQPAEMAGDDYLERLQLLDQTERLHDATLYELRYKVLGGARAWNLYSQAFDYATLLAETSPQQASQWVRLAVMASLQQASLYPRGYLTVPAFWHTVDAVASAQAGDRENTDNSLKAAALFQPMDITLAEDYLPKIRDAGMSDIADQTVDRIFNTGQAYLKRFPRDANSLNNLAWVSTINGRNYDQSLSLARMAVFLDPDSTSYRDTLAEVLFRLGRSREAIEIERQCLLDDPGHWHLHEQLERFQAANPN